MNSSTLWRYRWLLGWVAFIAYLEYIQLVWQLARR